MMWASLRRLGGLLSPRQRWQASLLVLLLIGNALLEMIGVGLLPLYISVLAEPERLLQNARLAQALSMIGIDSGDLTERTMLYGGSAVLLVVFSVKAAYVSLLAYARASYIQNVVQALGVRLIDSYFHAPYEFHLNRHSAELMRNSAAECTRLGEMLLNPLVGMVSQSLITGAIVALLMSSELGAALPVLLGFGIVTVPLVATLSRRIKSIARVAQDGRARVIRVAQEGLSGVKEVRLLQREAYFVHRFGSALRQVLDLQRVLQVTASGLPVIVEWLAVATLLLTVVIMYRPEEPQTNLLGVVALFAVAMARLKGSVTGMLTNYAQVRSSVVSVDAIARDFRRLGRSTGDARTEAVRPRTVRLQLADGICLDDVWFRYAGSDDYVLRGIDLTIRKGESVAIVGPSGGGKSTLIDVILGILQPECGSVRADGADIREDLAAWQRIVGYVPQSPYLIDGTVRQNIALGLDDRDIDDLAVARVVAAASLEELVNSLAEGLNTNIGERGVRLSGGQRQRIAIARALYDGPQVLVMDEATSALDNLAEQGIMQAASSLKGQRTILLIAHRLSTVRNCDRVVFLCGGTITGVGTYESLLASHEEFRNMVHRS